MWIRRMQWYRIASSDKIWTSLYTFCTFVSIKTSGLIIRLQMQFGSILRAIPLILRLDSICYRKRTACQPSWLFEIVRFLNLNLITSIELSLVIWLRLRVHEYWRTWEPLTIRRESTVGISLIAMHQYIIAAKLAFESIVIRLSFIWLLSIQFRCIVQLWRLVIQIGKVFVSIILLNRYRCSKLSYWLSVQLLLMMDWVRSVMVRWLETSIMLFDGSVIYLLGQTIVINYR